MNTPHENRMRVAQLNAEGGNMPTSMTGDEVRHAQAMTKIGGGRGKTQHEGGWSAFKEQHWIASQR